MNKSAISSIIIIVILLISIAFLYNQNQNLQQIIASLTKNIDELQTQKPDPTKPEPTSEKLPEGWKEYVDDEYKFRIWYPKEFSYKDVTDQTKIEKFSNGKEKGMVFYVNVLTDAPLILTNIYNSNISLKDYVISDAAEIIKYFPLIMLQNKDVESYITEIKSNGLTLYKFELPDDNSTKYYVKNGGNIFVFWPKDGVDFFKLRSVIDQMVSSFKFIE